jgi:hypothetical protein
MQFNRDCVFAKIAGFVKDRTADPALARLDQKRA